MEDFSRTALLVEEEAQSKDVADGHPEIQMRIIFVLFHEESRSAMDTKTK